MSIITINSFEPICNKRFHKDNPTILETGDIVYCAPEDVKWLFEQIQDTDIRIILVSSGSDYGIHYQSESHPNFDLEKCVYALDFNELAAHKDYVTATLKTAKYEDCVATDKFSVKIDRYTINTFPSIPKNIVKWFCVNANITEPQVEFLPYGVNSEGEGKDIVSGFYKEYRQKQNKVYANFQINSVGRYFLKNYLRTLANKIPPEDDWLTYIERPNMPVDQYYKQLADHTLVLATAGNGLDSYRIWETLEVGSVPIVEQSYWANNALLAGIDMIVLSYEKLSQFNYAIFKLMREYISAGTFRDRKVLNKEYWIEKINNSRGLCYES